MQGARLDYCACAAPDSNEDALNHLKTAKSYFDNAPSCRSHGRRFDGACVRRPPLESYINASPTSLEADSLFDSCTMGANEICRILCSRKRPHAADQ